MTSPMDWLRGHKRKASGLWNMGGERCARSRPLNRNERLLREVIDGEMRWKLCLQMRKIAMFTGAIDDQKPVIFSDLCQHEIIQDPTIWEGELRVSDLARLHFLQRGRHDLLKRCRGTEPLNPDLAHVRHIK